MTIELNLLKENLNKTKKEVKSFYKKYNKDIKKLPKKSLSQINLINILLKENLLLRKIEQKQKEEIENLSSKNEKLSNKNLIQYNNFYKKYFNIGNIWS